MKKLNLSELRVESFRTSEDPAARGTVLGYATWPDPECPASGNSFCSTDVGMESCNAAPCQGTYHDPNCNTGTGPPATSLYTCGQDTCVKGATHCGTCEQPSCIPGTGCGGTTDGIWQC